VNKGGKGVVGMGGGNGGNGIWYIDVPELDDTLRVSISTLSTPFRMPAKAHLCKSSLVGAVR
jgi:hypothetical protein